MKTSILLSTILSLLISTTDMHAQIHPETEKTLVVYFSRSGHTREAANLIREATGGDMIEIETAEPYPEDYDELTKQAKREIETGYRPVLKTEAADPEAYDRIFVGSPCWWGTIAPPVASFLSSHDLSGKTVVPFMTHGGSGLGHSAEDIRKLCPDAAVADGLAIRDNSAKNARNEISKWLRDNRYIR